MRCRSNVFDAIHEFFGGKHIVDQQQAPDDRANRRTLWCVDDTGMRYAARRKPKKVAVLCKDHSACLEGERELSFM